MVMSARYIYLKHASESLFRICIGRRSFDWASLKRLKKGPSCCWLIAQRRLLGADSREDVQLYSSPRCKGSF